MSFVDQAIHNGTRTQSDCRSLIALFDGIALLIERHPGAQSTVPRGEANSPLHFNPIVSKFSASTEEKQISSAPSPMFSLSGRCHVDLNLCS